MRSGYVVLAAIGFGLSLMFGVTAGTSLADTEPVEVRIAKFWQRVNAMQPTDYLGSSDLGQWALNVIERDPRARLTVADFRAATAQMQASLDRAGPAGTTPTPTPTPSPASANVVTYSDGWRLTLLEWGEQLPGQYVRPGAGMRYVFVRVRFDNGSTRPIYASRSDFRLQDGTGVRRSYAFTDARNDDLDSGDVAPGALVTGTLVFEAPIGDASLSLLYSKYTYSQSTFRLR